jgi:competence protein ComEC
VTSAVEHDHRADLRLVPAAATSWAVTCAGILWSIVGVVTAVLLTVAAAMVATWWSRGRGEPVARMTAASATAVVLVGLGFGVAVALRVEHVRHHPLTARYGSVAAAVVTPTETPRPLGSGRLMFRGSLRSVDGVEMSGRVVVFASMAGFTGLTAGRPAAFKARVSKPNRRDLTVAVLSSTGEPTMGEAAPVQRAADAVRTTFAASARSALPADQAAMLPALVLGDTSAVTPEVTAQFRTAGLTHLTAVSGANVTIVCGAVLLSGSLLGPRAAVALAAVALLAFVIVVQPSASVLRAAVMGAITLLAIVTHRRRQAIPALSAAVIVLMVGAPELSVDVGFALSVSATAALIVIAPAWSRRLVAHGWPKPLADAVSVAIAAQLVTAPLVAAISGTFSVVAVVANLAVAVVVAPITVVGTAAAALTPLWPAGAELLIRFTGPEVWWLMNVARWASRLPGAAVAVPAGPVGALTLAAVLAVVGIVSRWCWRTSCRRGMTRSGGERDGPRTAPGTRG